MKEINISFKELIDYVRDKDFEIYQLKSIEKRLRHENNLLKEEKSLITNYLLEKGITLGIERNRVFEIRNENENI